MAIYVYNRNLETHDGENNYHIFRPYTLSNPYTHIKDRKTKAKYVVSTRDESIRMYDKYFDTMYANNVEFRDVVDEMYEKYINGEDIYLECYCKKYLSSDTTEHKDEVSCHGDIIKEKLIKRAFKQRVKELRQNNKI